MVTATKPIWCRITDTNCLNPHDCLFCQEWVDYLNGGSELATAKREAKSLKVESDLLRQRIGTLTNQIDDLVAQKRKLLDRVDELKVSFEAVKGMESTEQIAYLMRKAKV